MSTLIRSSQTAALLASAVALVACQPAWADAAKEKGASNLQAIPGSPLKRVVLTAKAASRLDIKLGATATDAAGMLSTPYASVLYDVKGNTWVYLNPEPLVYVRQAVTVVSVKGPHAVLKDGPAAGTKVVVVGASELYGAESGIGH